MVQSVMAGIAQLNKFPQHHRAHIHDMLFTHKSQFTYRSYSHYSDGYRDWSDPSYEADLKPLHYSRGWQFLQGQGLHQGEAFGGCIEVLSGSKGHPTGRHQIFGTAKFFFWKPPKKNLVSPMSHAGYGATASKRYLAKSQECLSAAPVIIRWANKSPSMWLC
jgi:hypothetical protein